MSDLFLPRDYQGRAIGEMVKQLEERLAKLTAEPTVSPPAVRLKAPTGSGKTAMALATLAQLADDTHDHNLAFIWIAPNQLQRAAYAAVPFAAGAAIRAAAWDEVGGDIGQNQALFLNWSSVNKRDKNTVRVPRESGKYLAAVISATRAAGRQIVLIIDETHIANDTDAKAARDVFDEIGPVVRLEMSATLKDATYRVRRNEAVAEGIIRTQVVGNPEDEVRGGHNSEGYLNLALAKRDGLAAAYVERGIAINPLLIVQLPNKGAGSLALDEVRTLLRDRGLREGPDGDVVVWLSEDKPEWLTDPRDPRLVAPNAKVKILICKQAVATGWDCPRAQVLYKIRPASKSETFDIQTIGRIMRASEPGRGTPYGDELLDTGWVYHEDETYQADEDEDDGYRDATAARRIEALTIPTQIARRQSTKLEPEHLARVVETVLSSALDQLDFSAAPKTQTIAGGKLADDDERMKGGTFTDFYRGPASTETRFYELTDRWAEGQGAPLRSEICWQVRGQRPDEDIARIQAAFVDRGEALDTPFEAAIKKTRQAEGLMNERLPVEHAWEMPLTQTYRRAERAASASKDDLDDDAAFYERVEDPHARYAYDPCYLKVKKEHSPEALFERWLRGLPDEIEWWWKNAEREVTDFSLIYQYEDQWLNFFPDYLVRWRDGTLALYEVKSHNAFDPSGQENAKNKSKSEALRDFVASSPERLEGRFALVERGRELLFYSDHQADPETDDDIRRRHRP